MDLNLNKITALFGSDYLWIAQVFLVVLAILVINYFVRKLVVILQLRLQQTKTLWDDAALEAARKPAIILVWVLGLSYAAEIILKQTGSEIFAVFALFRQVGVLLSLTWFLIRLVSGVEGNLVKQRQHEVERERGLDVATLQAVSKLLRMAIIITSSLVVLQTLGYSVSGVLAFGGIGGVAVGFAAKDLLANFFGGLMVYLDRPFVIGDWVRSPDRDIEGTVEYIGWRLTRIRSFDKRPLYIPNAIFTNIVVENPSRMSNRRIYETIGIRYDDVGNMGVIVADVKKYLQSHDAIDTDATLMVNFNAFAPSSCDFFVYAFTKTTVWVDFHEIKQEILLKIAEIIDNHGAEIAYPTSSLHIAGPINLEPSEQHA